MNYFKLFAITTIIFLAIYFSYNLIVPIPPNGTSQPPAVNKIAQHSTSVTSSAVQQTSFSPLTSPLTSPQQHQRTTKPDIIPKDSQGRPLYKANQLLVIFKPEATDQEIEILNQRLGSTILRKLKSRRLYTIQLRPNLSIPEAIEAYNNSGIVEKLGKNSIRYPFSIQPNDPSYSKQWNMDIINGPAAWEIDTGSKKTIVAIIDTGVNYQHHDLASNIWTNITELNGVAGIDDDSNGYIDDIHGWDFADTDNNPSDIAEHGTHIAGIIGAVGNNSVGVAGINWHIQLMPLKVQANLSPGFTTSAIIEALDYAAKMGAKIINCSYGGESYDQLEYEAMADLQKAGIIAVCASGNSGVNIDTLPEYPASFNLDNIIAVAATDKSDNLASYSNFGAIGVDLAAPGENIYSTVASTVTLASSIRHDTTPPVEYAASSLEYGGVTDSAGISGSLIDCGFGATAHDFPPEVANNIALIGRDIQTETQPRTTTFFTKVNNAQKAGALGSIIYDDNTSSSLPFNNGTLGSVGNWLPALTVTFETGSKLKLIPSLESVTLFSITNTQAPQYQYLSGTSMAAPHVTGTAALLYSLNAKLSAQEIKDIIISSVQPIAELKDKTVSGGRLDLLESLRHAFIAGDVNGDTFISLADAVISLQVLSSENNTISTVSPKTYAEINGDKHFGIEEAIFILHKIAGL